MPDYWNIVWFPEGSGQPAVSRKNVVIEDQHLGDRWIRISDEEGQEEEFRGGSFHLTKV